MRKGWEVIYLKQGLDNHPLISYIYSMKEIKIKVENASHKQWALLLIELNMLKDSWRRYGPTLNIKANTFNKIIKWGRRKHDENLDHSDPPVQRRRSLPSHRL